MSSTLMTPLPLMELGYAVQELGHPVVHGTEAGGHEVGVDVGLYEADSDGGVGDLPDNAVDGHGLDPCMGVVGCLGGVLEGRLDGEGVGVFESTSGLGRGAERPDVDVLIRNPAVNVAVEIHPGSAVPEWGVDTGVPEVRGFHHVRVGRDEFIDSHGLSIKAA